MATLEDILTRLEKLEKENETLSKRIEALEKGKSTTKKTPKTKSNLKICIVLIELSKCA